MLLGVFGLPFSFFFFFFFKQKTAYEMRISDWSSDVCSSDLRKERIAVLDHHILRVGRDIDDLFDGGGVEGDTVLCGLHALDVVVDRAELGFEVDEFKRPLRHADQAAGIAAGTELFVLLVQLLGDRKSTRLNSSP